MEDYYQKYLKYKYKYLMYGGVKGVKDGKGNTVQGTPALQKPALQKPASQKLNRFGKFRKRNENPELSASVGNVPTIDPTIAASIAYFASPPDINPHVPPKDTTDMIEGTIKIHINNILFTHNSISHSFKDPHHDKNITNNIETIIGSQTKPTLLSFEQIYKILEIEVAPLKVLLYEGKIYSCNNRRLCMLKTLHRKGYFDGGVLCTGMTTCGHENTCLGDCTDTLVTFGDTRAPLCSEL